MTSDSISFALNSIIKFININNLKDKNIKFTIYPFSNFNKNSQIFGSFTIDKIYIDNIEQILNKKSNNLYISSGKKYIYRNLEKITNDKSTNIEHFINERKVLFNNPLVLLNNAKKIDVANFPNLNNYHDEFSFTEKIYEFSSFKVILIEEQRKDSFFNLELHLHSNSHFNDIIELFNLL